MESEFELPVVNTVKLLKRQHKEFLMSNPDKSRIAIARKGDSVKVFDFNISMVGVIDRHQIISETKYYLKLISNAYKWLDESILRGYLMKVGVDIQNRCLGYRIPDDVLLEFVNDAIIEKDTMEIRPNRSIRFLKNPYYLRKVSEDNSETKEINQLLGQERRSETFEIIEIALADYDLNSRTLTKSHLADLIGLSNKTVSSYLKEHPELREMYDAIKSNSGTEEQQMIRRYYEENRRSA
ncbi:hypothetical protein [Robiginitalea aurantiaca]|uniref:Uncharacterized protein n=1 Tax=Robiginitalea aurantiaca TaxID=3056915 RepID=A0ABT7WFA7_9FLAO|nr:hypothetical protein [Robiginitalea aurantiaca]MDM9631611.1 hypothetical protein [Robiginitalea aurantiaca]